MNRNREDILEEIENLKKVVRALRRRRYVLDEQAASEGVQSRPQVITEIQDLNKQIEAREKEISVLEIELSRHRVPSPTASSTPPIEQPTTDSAALSQLWKVALTAFFTKDWERAELLLDQVCSYDPNYRDVQARLAEVKRQRHLQLLYREICELRNEDQWQAVLGALEELDRQQPNYPDIEGVRRWAEGRQHKEAKYDEALTAFDKGDWRLAITALNSLLSDFPDDNDAILLLNRAKIEQKAQNTVSTPKGKKNCPRCGFIMPESNIFCPNCGLPLLKKTV